MADTYMQYVDEDNMVTARWWGGAYIEFGWIDESGEWRATDVINVYDYAKGETNIPFTLDAMREAIEEHLNEDDDEDEDDDDGVDFEPSPDPNWMND